VLALLFSSQRVEGGFREVPISSIPQAVHRVPEAPVINTTPDSEKAPRSRLIPRVRFCICFAVVLVYIAQLWTPLRLTGDSIELLSIASSAADGHGFLSQGRATHYPPGYPTMVICLERLGLANSAGLVGLNALLLLIGSASASYVALNYFCLGWNWAAMTLLCTIFNFVLIKHFTLPLSDVPFFGMSLTAVMLTVKADREQGKKYLAFLFLALLVSVLSVLVRSIGIALFPSLAWSLSVHFRVRSILFRNRRLLIGACTAAALICCIGVAVLVRTKYINEAMAILRHKGIANAIGDILLFRLREIGELLLNIPASRLGRLAPVIPLIGVAAGVALIRYAGRCKVGPTEVYLLAYIAIIFLWPYNDTRFWIPVLPLMFAEFFSVARPWSFAGWRRRIAVSYGVTYALLGCCGLAYSTLITFSGTDFPRRYGDWHLRATYQFFYSKGAMHQSGIDGLALETLRRYSRHSGS
jgi:hypothetical protein